MEQNTPYLWAAVLVGALSAIIGEWIGPLPNGHKLNDPVLAILTISNLLTNGPLYVLWENILIVVGHSAAVGYLTPQLAAKLSGGPIEPADAPNYAMGAILIGMLPILIQEVSNFRVLVWYFWAGLLAILVAGFSAQATNRKRKQP